jgi:hypothetical protein
MPSPWRRSPGASTHPPRLRLRLRLPPLAHSSLLHHRPPPRRLPLSLVLLPPGRAGVGGPSGPPRPPRTQWWGSSDSYLGSDPSSCSSSWRCTLADLLQPVVRVYLHVAPSGSRRGASFPAPTGGHGHECYLLRVDLDSTPSAQLVVAEGVGSGCLGAVLQHCGVDATRWHRVDRRLRCLLLHHSRCGYPFFCPTSSPLLSFFHHGR